MRSFEVDMRKWYRVAELEDVTDARPVSRVINGRLIGLFRVGHDISAVSNVCTHEHAVLTDGWQDGFVIECPLHQARFDVRTGKCLSPPAEDDLEVFPVKIEGEAIYVCVGDDSEQGIV